MGRPLACDPGLSEEAIAVVPEAADPPLVQEAARG
jgi:hypothetical protein